MTNFRQFQIPKPCVIPRLAFFVIPRLDRGISSQRILKFPSFLELLPQSPKDSASLEFDRNSRILVIARSE
ncbi:hypothetical protein [Campylobacter sp.]|uniref:hypothetical protein n=1 Tax=Campylobacter sp. TaxID=205 RepID=UPI002A81AEB6|nr:hypothetical protein [Campylobacter sp.]